MLAPLKNQLKSVRFILASASPRRQEYIQNLGINAELYPSNFDEKTIIPTDYSSYHQYVQEIALGKAEEVYNRLQNDLNGTKFCIIGADTIVTMDKKIYGKPENSKVAFRMLSELNGKAHIVYTGCVLKFNDKVIKFTESAKVFFGKLTDEQIQGYVDTEEPLDKAGAYGIQGKGGCLIERVEGDYFSVVGFPLYRISSEICKAFDYKIE